jgi:apolipoprotein N-acyltransferase
LITQFGDFGALGSTQHGNLPLLQLASVTGVLGISFVVAWFASVVNWAWTRGFAWRHVRVVALAHLAVLVLVLVTGCARLIFFAPVTDTVRVAGISASRGAEEASTEALRKAATRYWDAENVLSADPVETGKAFAHVNDDLVTRTRQEARAGARIVLWSETEARVLERDRGSLIERVAAVAQEHGVYVNMAYALYTDHAPYVRNIATLIEPDGRVAWNYDKAHPTPMEPMKPGDGNVPVAESPHGRLATVICYDADFPELMRKAGLQGADLVMVPSNDWYTFKDLHAQKAVFRAVENGYSLVRPSAHGVSSAVDSHGRVLSEVDYFRADQQSLVANIPLQRRTPTIYSAVGDLFAWLCLAVTGGLITLVVVRRRREQRGN